MMSKSILEMDHGGGKQTIFRNRVLLFRALSLVPIEYLVGAIDLMYNNNLNRLMKHLTRDESPFITMSQKELERFRAAIEAFKLPIVITDIEMNSKQPPAREELRELFGVDKGMVSPHVRNSFLRNFLGARTAQHHHKNWNITCYAIDRQHGADQDPVEIMTDFLIDLLEPNKTLWESPLIKMDRRDKIIPSLLLDMLVNKYSTDYDATNATTSGVDTDDNSEDNARADK